MYKQIYKDKKGKRKTPGDGVSVNALDYFLVSDRKEIDKYKPMFCSYFQPFSHLYVILCFEVRGDC
jgi:hypothetical protein